jgi:hypothetical protein
VNHELLAGSGVTLLSLPAQPLFDTLRSSAAAAAVVTSTPSLTSCSYGSHTHDDLTISPGSTMSATTASSLASTAAALQQQQQQHGSTSTSTSTTTTTTGGVDVVRLSMIAKRHMAREVKEDDERAARDKHSNNNSVTNNDDTHTHTGHSGHHGSGVASYEHKRSPHATNAAVGDDADEIEENIETAGDGDNDDHDHYNNHYQTQASNNVCAPLVLLCPTFRWCC